MTSTNEKGTKPEVVNGKAIFRVAAKTSVPALSGAIAKSLEDGMQVETHSIGAGAINQAVKGIAKARGFVAMKGRDLVVRPGFKSTVIDNEERSTLVLVVTMQ